MSLNKKKMVREIGRRTRIRNRDVQAVIEALIAVWTEELVSGGRIELEGFFVIETQIIDRSEPEESLGALIAPRYIQRAGMRMSGKFKELLCNDAESSTHTT